MSEPKQYTTAIIAAVPSPADPVHEVVAEDAHVTLQFLGEAADLTPEGVAEIQTTLEMLSSVVYPFPVSISGTAELGPDKAQVLIVQSELLTKVREMLSLSDAVSTALATSEQFPNWIPHLTLDYAGEMPDVASYKTVEIGSLELWLADEHHSYPLDQKAEPIAAAGQKIFEEGLHPRGADGRFIEKFGVIKFLSSMGWQYGKVDGIYHDQASGAIKLTVTPSDLSGNPKGESVVLSPKQVYRAPKAKTHLTTTAIGAKKVGGQGGSNPGGLYELPKSATGTPGTTTEAEKFYVKTPKTKSHGHNEALANALYEEAGVPVPEVDYHADGQLYSKIVTGQQDMAQQLNNEEWTDQVRRNFAVDAWLGNRDVFGMTYDNILTDENGVPWRIDNGGALLYRAMGAKKTDFGGQVAELDSMRLGKKAKIFGAGMTKAQELDGAERVLAISPGQIDEMVAEHNLPKSLADTLKARRLYIANYYGLTLPESKKPAEAEEPTSAPKIDAPDIAANDGHTRNWFKTNLAQLAMFGEAGDAVELPDGSTQLIGIGDDGELLSVIGQQAQLLTWQSAHGAASEVFLKKTINPGIPRPEHGATLAGADLATQRWKRGDHIIDSDGSMLKVLLWNESSGAMLVQFGDASPLLLDTKGKDSGDTYKVERWDPPAVDTLDTSLPEPATPVMTEQQALDEVDQIPLPEMPNATADTTDELTTYTMSEGGYTAPAPGKSGQAAVAEAQIKADLDQPLPAGNGTPAPKKTSAPAGAKVMVIGDGTEAATGDAVISKKDGKTYTFVKPKGNYAVVTDPNGEDPNKQLLKLASTMTQPGKAPAADTGTVEAPKTATGEVPALGMMAIAKDGWAGEITLISPDGKFVFITDANGTRKRKSVGTVSITSAPKGVPEAPKTAPGPLKEYGPAPTLKDAKQMLGGTPDFYGTDDLDAGDMVVVGYADGTLGLEPYTGQPTDSLLLNTQGKIGTPYALPLYKGPISDTQFITAAAASGNNGHNYTVVWDGTIAVTNGTTGPNGGLLLWSHDDPSENVFELPAGQTLTVLSSNKADGGASGSNTLPGFDQVQSAQDNSDFGYVAPGPLYNDEAKTLADWKGQISKGTKISLDGQNWLTVDMTAPISGNVIVTDLNGTETTISAKSLATFVIDAPQLKDGNDAPAWKPEVIAAVDVTDLPEMGVTKKKIGDFVQGDVITDGEGNIQIVDSVTDPHGLPDEVTLKVMGEDWGSPANPNYEFTHHGNITENPVDIPAGIVASHLYPGATLQFNSTDVPAQVVSFPNLQDNGSYKVVVMQDGDPDNLAMVTIGPWGTPGIDITNEAMLTASLGSFTSASDAGVDPTKINAIWDASTADTGPGVLDKKIEMAEQGVPFGTAAYPIHWNEGSGTFLRQGPAGQKQEWDAESGQWNDIFGSVTGYPKVWDGTPFEGQLSYPANIATLPPMLQSGAPVTDYKPQPGEIVQAGIVDMPSGPHSFLLVYQQGLDGPAHMVMSSSNPEHYQPHLTASPMTAGWKDTGTFHDLITIHDPFAEAGPIDRPVNHQIGPQPPSVLGAKLQTLGYTPSPGDTLWVMQSEVNGSPATVALLKQPDGNYKKINFGGSLGDKNWTPEELKGYQPNLGEKGAVNPDITHFTWTYQPATGEGGPALVPGLPEGFQPFEAGDGQSVLKVTLSNGKTNVYLQKQPGAGWYEMGPDGTVNENSDAVKSNHAVQMKLKKGDSASSIAKYELLHPVPEGSKAPGQAVPTFTSAADGDWTPEPHQKVMSMVGYDGDPNPWYWHQDEPGGYWEAAPNSPGAPTSISDATMQGYIEASKNNSFQPYTLVYDGASGQAAVDTPEKKLASFHGHVPTPGTSVYQEADTGDFWAQKEPGGKWHYVKPEGGYGGGLTGLDTDQLMTKVWPEEDASTPEAAPGAPTDFKGYTPKPGEKVAGLSGSNLEQANGQQSYWVQKEPGGGWFAVKNDGTVAATGNGVLDVQVQQFIADDQMQLVHGEAEKPPGSFGGYQTEAGDIVVQLTDASTQPIYIKKKSTGEWHLVKIDGTLSAESYSQSTLDWALGEYQVDELQGTIKGLVPDAPEPVVSTAYAGVESPTQLTDGNYHFGEFIPAADQLSKLKKLGALDTGQSAYALEYQEGGSSSAVLVRNSQGQWSSVLPTGELAAKMPNGSWGTAYTVANDDEAAEAYLKSAGFQLHKMQFTAPSAAPAAPVSSGPPAQLSGWAGKGIPDPASFSHISDPSQGSGAKAGDQIFVSANSSTGGGMIVKLKEDWSGTESFKISQVLPVGSGGVIAPNADWIDTADAPFMWQAANNHWISAQPTATAAPAAAPSAPSPAAPSAPAAPAYPGAQKPSQEDINAWGGALTKDGHIPTAQMFVTGKGPMSGKIISVSKDKSKAVVLTSDGKKTTRLIEALKVDISANYSAYAAPVTAKDIPQGMPLAVDTVGEALQKTAVDGKFRAILTAHPGVSQGQMVVTKTTAPSGKIFNRVHLTLTPAQREQLVAMLAGQGEKGDWATSSKMSEAVAIGDKLPMRLSSTPNPDNTPRWKVDPSQVPPTHEVTKVEDDPSGSGVKIVTMKDVNTGEEIVSRFHPGKSLTTYSWDPNKPKKITPGAFSVSALAKAQGWNLVNDGGISAIHGGAENGKLHHEPGSAISKSAMGHVGSKWQTLRNTSADGVVIELIDPKGSNSMSTTGVTVISVPQGVDETALGAALSKLGIDYSPMTQDSAKDHVRGLLRTLLNLDVSDVDTTKGWSDEKLFTQAGQSMGISDLGWQDVLVGVDESTGKTSYFWSDRARNALAAKSKYNLVYRAASTGNAAQIVSTVKYGSASSILKKTTGMLDGSSNIGNGASAGTDNSNHAGHGSYASASTVSKLPSSNAQAGYKTASMMVYHRPEAVLGRIMDYRVSPGDAFGKGMGQGSDHLKHATSMSSVKDFFLGGGLPTEAVGFIAVSDASARTAAIAQLKADGFAVINGRPVEDIIITKQKAATLTPNDLPPVTIPSNARPILDLPQSYEEAAPAAAVTADAGEAAA